MTGNRTLTVQVNRKLPYFAQLFGLNPKLSVNVQQRMRASIKRWWRQYVAASLKVDEQEPITGHLHVHVTQFVAPKERRMDSGNLIILVDKLILDNLVHLGYLRNDSPRHVRSWSVDWLRGGVSGVTVTISPEDL